ncbi:MAG: hypothetical protein AAGH65_04665 [Pseudomonadota bacterium]
MYRTRTAQFVLASLALLMAQAVLGQQADRVLDVSDASVNRGTVSSCSNGELPIVLQTPNQSNGVFSDADCGAFCASGQQAIADDFVLSQEETIGEITIWAGYFNTDNISDPLDDWTITFHSDVAGAPGAIVAGPQTVTPTGTLTGVTLFGSSEIEMVMNIAPVTLAAGTYWVEMTTNSVGNPDVVFWEVGDLDATAGRAGQVFSTSVPGTAWTNDATTEQAMVLCGAQLLPESQPVPTIGKAGIIIMVLMLMMVAGVSVRRFS